METLMKFFMELINMLLKLFGGTPIDIPSDGNPLPTDNPENPGVTTEPNQPNPTEPVEQQPQPCAPTESPSIAPVISNSVNPSTPPQSIPSVAPSISISNAPAGWKLTFADEFEGTSVAPTWSKIPYGLGQACLVMDNNNLKVANGNLVITATATNSSSCKWTSGGMQSLGKFSQHYGRFEMRAKLPADNLAWPAFWLLPEDNSYDGEIDILETIGGNNMDINGTLLPGNKHGAFTLHVPAGGPGPTKSCAVTPDFSSDYHLYTLEWTAEGMKMFIDNVQCANFTGYSDSGTNPPAFPATFNKPYFILVNLAIAPTSWGIQPPTTTTMTMDVDYIRVWQKQ